MAHFLELAGRFCKRLKIFSIAVQYNGKLTVIEESESIFQSHYRSRYIRETRRITLQDTLKSITPEMVLIIELIGQVENFMNAVRNIEGLEWFGEYEVEHVEHDDWFQDSSHSEKKGRIFLTMTNQKDLNQIENLFEKWCKNEKEKFPFRLAPLKETFPFYYILHKIRPWGMLWTGSKILVC
ncbi:MAG: hypothetical protein OXF84_04590 [Bacteroidetes bacterium]|nr:hypothetical protein [Bacteroidota bacterium]